MSNVNIKRAVENIRSSTNVYTPIVEIVVNAIQAIETSDKDNGEIEITINRDKQFDIDEKISDVIGFTVIDNGIGFNSDNRESFDTLYSELKISEGGKGFGRFTCLKYFDDLSVESIFFEDDIYKKRSFMMGKNKDIIINESVSDTSKIDSGSVVRLMSVKPPKFSDKKITTIARTLVEKLLPYFVSEDQKCPDIILKDDSTDDSILLNDYLNKEGVSLIKEVISANGDFSLESGDFEKEFRVRVFKFYSPKNQKSKVSLVAHRREVTNTGVHKYIPEFVEEFYDKNSHGGDKQERNFIVKVYVFGDYLDGNVSLERGGFEFQKERDVFYGISQVDIEQVAAKYAMQVVNSDVDARKERKAQQVRSYVQEHAPWHTSILDSVDLSDIPYNPTNEQIESRLHKEKYSDEVRVRAEVKKLLENDDVDDLKIKAAGIVRRISGSSKNELVHYVALRRSVIDIFEKSLQLDSDGDYSSEGVVHDIIFPRKGDSLKTDFNDHNLWLIDERLNFTEYVSSDLPLKGGRSGRPDLLAYDKRVVFRGENEASNPVTIFEFKKPQRDDFVNPSSDEDPVQQIVRYVRKIRAGDFKTPEGREMLVSQNTPFYGYVVCDLTKKVRSWIEEEKDFKPMPDRMGYFKWHENLNLYTEVIGWDKVLKDATMRNKIFFHKLGIH